MESKTITSTIRKPAPWGTRTVDIVLMINHVEPDATGKWPDARHFREPVQLSDDLWLGPCRDESEAIMDACQPVGENTLKPHRMFFAKYALWRDFPEGFRDRGPWDPGHRLGTCLQLSRLARHTTMSYEYACRVRHDGRGQREIIPAQIRGPGGLAYVADERHNWLDDADVGQIVELLARFRPGDLPNRVKQAMWLHEYVAWNEMTDVRWPLATTALECLIHTDRPGSTRQFVSRLPQAVKLAGGEPPSEEDLNTIYDERSRLAHGQGVANLTSELRRLYLSLEHVLRDLLRRAILDPSFAAVFATEDSIRKAFPIA